MNCVPVEYVAYRFDSGKVCGLPNLFSDQKFIEKKTKKTLTYLLYWSHNIVDHVQSGRPQTTPAYKLNNFLLLYFSIAWD